MTTITIRLYSIGTFPVITRLGRDYNGERVKLLVMSELLVVANCCSPLTPTKGEGAVDPEGNMGAVRYQYRLHHLLGQVIEYMIPSPPLSLIKVQDSGTHVCLGSLTPRTPSPDVLGWAHQATAHRCQNLPLPFDRCKSLEFTSVNTYVLPRLEERSKIWVISQWETQDRSGLSYRC